MGLIQRFLLLAVALNSLCFNFISGENISNFETTAHNIGCNDAGNGLTEFIITADYDGGRNLPVIYGLFERVVEGSQIPGRPRISVSFYNLQNQNTRGSRNWKRSCPNQEFNAHDTACVGNNYKDQNGVQFQRGHLTTRCYWGYAPEANDATYYCANASPQYPAFNGAWWRQVEEPLLFTARQYNGGVVMTGICPSGDIRQIGGQTNFVSSCFWNLLCYKDPVVPRTVVAGYFGTNAVNFQISGLLTQEQVIQQTGMERTIIQTGWRNSIALIRGSGRPGNWPDAEACIAAMNSYTDLPIMRDINSTILEELRQCGEDDCDVCEL